VGSHGKGEDWAVGKKKPLGLTSKARKRR